MFSKSCEYGLRAVIYIAQQSALENKVGLLEISEEINSPKPFTSKVLQRLTKSKIVTSLKGPYGGFTIEENQLNTIRLSAVVSLFDGDSIYTGCGLGLHKCNEKAPCPLHFKFVKIRDELKAMLENTTLKMLVDDMNTELFFLK